MLVAKMAEAAKKVSARVFMMLSSAIGAFFGKRARKVLMGFL